MINGIDNIEMNKIKIFTISAFFTTLFVFSQENIKHKVLKGETIYAIAREYKMTINAIYELNPSIKGTTLKIGAILKLPNNNLKQTNFGDAIPKNHTVSKGESFYAISKKYNISREKLELWNPTIKPKDLKVGTILQIAYDDTIAIVEKEEQIKPIVINTSSKEANKKDSTFTVIHVIQPKETRYGISKKYGITVHELEVLNSTIPSDFPVGYQLIIKKDQVAIADNTKPIQDSTSLSSDEEQIVEKMSKAFTSKADLLVEKASEYIGIKYKYGGITPKGFDCSGLMCTTFKEIDLSLPRTSFEQATYGEKIDQSESQRGDLIFFATGRRNRISHVGMITEVNEDEIMFIHASSSEGVIVSSLNEAYYASRFVKINRVLQ